MHNTAMRNHSQIVRDAGHSNLAELTASSIHTVRSWEGRNSIPSGHWKTIIDAGLAKADELIAAAAKSAA